MPSLLSPAFLFGLLAVAVPIFVHLRMRERRTSQPFPSLMFVRRIPHKSFRRRTLQNLLLFAARTLALVLLCLAFARPYFPVKAQEAATSGPLARVVALDVSASLRYEGVFPRAIAEAERAIRETRPTDAVGLLLFSDQAQGLVPPSTDHEKALAALKDAAPGARSTRFAPALRLAGDWLSALKADRREIVLVTDGQMRALAGSGDVPLPAGSSIKVRSVAAASTDNTAVAEVTVEPVPEAERMFAVVTARLVHQGPAGVSVRATLEVAGRLVEEKTVALPASGATSVVFGRAPLPAGISKGRIVLSPDAFPADNTFHFVLGGGDDVGVLLIDESPYVARALEIGTQPTFSITRRSALSTADLAGRSLVVLGGGGSASLSPTASTALTRFVREGGGVLATAPLTGLRGEAASLLPASWGETVSRLGDRGASLGFVDLDHPGLIAFKQARGSDFSRARFLQYRLLKEDRDEGTPPLRVLARFDDGREALVESTVGAGRVLAFTSPLDGLMSDLPVQPLFLPLIHELARYASAHKSAPLFHRVGSAVSLGTEGPSEPTRSRRVTFPSGHREDISGNDAGVELEEAGFYEATSDKGETTLVAVNLETVESDLTSMDAAELEAALRPRGQAAQPMNSVTPAEEGARQSWWRLALVAMALLLVTEMVLGNARGPKATS